MSTILDSFSPASLYHNYIYRGGGRGAVSSHKMAVFHIKEFKIASIEVVLKSTCYIMCLISLASPLVIPCWLSTFDLSMPVMLSIFSCQF